jgi:hypothetical protein
MTLQAHQLTTVIQKHPTRAMKVKKDQNIQTSRKNHLE